MTGGRNKTAMKHRAGRKIQDEIGEAPTGMSHIGVRTAGAMMMIKNHRRKGKNSNIIVCDTICIDHRGSCCCHCFSNSGGLYKKVN